MKLAVVSHILPPSPSGQAMVLYRLLKGLPAESYCLISCEDYSRNDRPFSAASSRLAGRYYALTKPEPLQINVMQRLKLHKTMIVLNTALLIFDWARQLRDILRKEHCEAIIACTGHPYDLPAASLAGLLTGLPVIPYLFDDYLYQWIGFDRTLARWFEPSIIKHARSIIVPNEYTQQEYRVRYGVQSTVIHNPCELPDLGALDAAERMFDDHETAIVYTGSVYHAHYDAFRNLISSLALLKNANARLHIFTAQPEEQLVQNGLSGPQVVYHSHVPQSEVALLLRKADVLFLPLAFDSPIPEVIRTSAPGKIGEYLASGRPILVHAPQDTFITWYFRKHDCGIVVDNNDPMVLTTELARLLSDPKHARDMGIRARARAELDFDVDIAVKQFQHIMHGSGQELPDYRKGANTD
jgi:glycosyltransferase involved in cell wall biosynthesis